MSYELGKHKQGRVPNPGAATLTYLVNPEPPPRKEGRNMAAKKKGKSLQRDASGRFLPAGTRSENKSTPKKPGTKGKKSNPGKSPTKKGKKKSNPDDLKAAINSIPDQVMDLFIAAIAWAIPGGIAVLIGDQGRASLAQTFKTPEGGQLAISAGWAVVLFGATTYFQPLKAYRKRAMLGAGLRLFFDAMNWGLSKDRGSIGANVRAFMGLPGADFRMGGAAAGGNGATGLKVQLDGEQRFFYNDAGVTLVAADVVLVGDAWTRASDKAPLLKPDGTPWKKTDVAALKTDGLSGLGSYYYMWPQIPQAPGNLQGAYQAQSPQALAGDLGSYWKLGLGEQPAYNPPNTVNGFVSNYVWNARTGQYELAAVQQVDSATGIGAFYNARPMSQVSRQLPKAGPQDDASFRL